MPNFVPLESQVNTIVWKSAKYRLLKPKPNFRSFTFPKQNKARSKVKALLLSGQVVKATKEAFSSFHTLQEGGSFCCTIYKKKTYYTDCRHGNRILKVT